MGSMASRIFPSRSCMAFASSSFSMLSRFIHASCSSSRMARCFSGWRIRSMSRSTKSVSFMAWVLPVCALSTCLYPLRRHVCGMAPGWGHARLVPVQDLAAEFLGILLRHPSPEICRENNLDVAVKLPAIVLRNLQVIALQRPDHLLVVVLALLRCLVCALDDPLAVVVQVFGVVAP